MQPRITAAEVLTPTASPQGSMRLQKPPPPIHGALTVAAPPAARRSSNHTPQAPPSCNYVIKTTIGPASNAQNSSTEHSPRSCFQLLWHIGIAGGCEIAAGCPVGILPTDPIKVSYDIVVATAALGFSYQQGCTSSDL